MAVDRVTRPHADDLVERLDLQVRERVRREGVDPQREALVVRRIAEDVVRDHDDLSLTGAVAPVADDSAMVGELVARVSGFGPLQPFLDDPEVEEVWINDPSRVFIARRGRHELTNLRLDAAQVNELVERMLKSSGRRLDISTPFVDAMLPEGHRLHVVLEGITRGFTAVNIRKFLLRAHRLSDLVALGSLTPQAARFLEASVRAGLNILVAGGTQAGKTTMLNCLAAAVPGGERVVSAEEVFELRFSHPDWVAMQTRQAGLEQTGEIVLRDLVKEALRMRPSRILVGEVRAAECLDLLLALNSGLPGMCTLHANSAREALVKMCTLPLLAGDNISARFVVPTVATSVDLVVHLGLGADGVRRVNEIVSVPGRVEADVIEVEPIFVRQGAELRRTGGVPARVERYERVGIDVHQLLASDRRSLADGRARRARGGRRPAADLVRLRPAAQAAVHDTDLDGTGSPPRPGRPGGRDAGERAVAVRRPLRRGLRARAGRLADRPGGGRVRCHGRLPPDRRAAPAGGPPAARLRRGVARGGRQPRERRTRRALPPRRRRRARHQRTRGAARTTSPSSPSTTRSPAGSASASTGSRTGSPTRSATA